MFKKLTHLLFILFVGSLFLGQLSRLPLPGGGVGAIYLSDLMLFGLVIFWLIWRLWEEKKLEINLIDYLVGLFAFTTLISLILAYNHNSLNELLIGAFYWLRLVAYLLLYHITVDLKPNLTEKFGWMLEWLMAFFAGAGLLQFVVFPDFSKYVQHGWDPHYYRVLSTFFDPNYAGIFLIFGFFYVLNQVYEQKEKRLLLRGTFLILILAALVLTFSRSTYLAFGVASIVFGWLKDKRIILVLFFASLISFIAIPRVRNRVIGALNVDQTAKLRLVDYAKTWKIIEDYPVFGVGFNTLRYVKDDYGYFRDGRGVNQESGHAGAGADNSLLFIWATGGVVSLLVLLWLLAAFGFASLTTSGASIILPSLLALFVHAQFVNSLFYTSILSWLLIMVGWKLHSGSSTSKEAGRNRTHNNFLKP